MTSAGSHLNRRQFLAAGAAATASLAFRDQRTQSRFRYGIVGAGSRSHNGHLKILKSHVPEVEVAAICDITPATLQQALAAIPGARGYDDYRRMLDEEKDLDAVLVVVPNYKHAEIALAALEAGKHVLVEKPMALVLTDADHMIEAARRKKLVLQIGQQERYSLLFGKMKELIGQGVIGDPLYVSAHLFRGDWNPRSWQYTDPSTGKSTNWRFLNKTLGSSLLEDAIHELDIVHWLLGTVPARIQAQGGNAVFKDRETIDDAGLLVEYANGARLNFGFTLFSPKLSDWRAIRVTGPKGEISMAGGNGPVGEIEIKPFQGSAQRISVSRWPEETPSAMRTGGHDPETFLSHQAFLRSIRDGAPVFVDGEVGRNSIHVCIAAERSLRSNRILHWEDKIGL